jgi:uridine kinase
MSEGYRLDLKPQHYELARQLRDHLHRRFDLGSGCRRVIGVGGESGSGKSITATCLAAELDRGRIRSLVLHQDDYFHRPPRANHAFRCLDLANVGCHEVDLARLASHVAAFRARHNGVSGPIVDYPNDRFLTRRLDFGPVDVLIVEGTYVLGLPDLDIRIFLAATHTETRERRRIRKRDVDEPVLDDILAIEHTIIRRYRASADVVIDAAFTILPPGMGSTSSNG